MPKGSKKPSKKRYEKRVEKKRLQVAFARINRGDPGPVRGVKNIQTATKRPTDIQTPTETPTETPTDINKTHTGLDTLDPLTRLGRLRARSGYIGAKGGPGHPAT